MNRNDSSNLLEQGSVVWCDPEPLVVGHEQAGRRPVLVVSNEAFNSKTGFVKVVAITNTHRSFPTRVMIPDEVEFVRGDILSDQERTIQPSSRNPVLMGIMPDDVVTKVLDLINKSY
ncbi:type II toxin-antitoxin system PemK/MazF family toxin [Fructilactobacillus myrtifloralis]|uniref:Type II toxin-antitoxin system PemK/MazF family toxin n=1 Tax=Fructilactobacillus myrtifloralis TaxID=2940301 RepID=A0ABY5BQI6_9LACO|nr:type II toxin-antitoxin system PemK/MazF family toxin [Fructilactobacillus myrtifloralis]USS84669.1 type II toxin-antitoxin system PemK/MazF family toxin [Fructilactobacillus myrtifloralis]